MPSLYAQWRKERSPGPALREEDRAPRENLLQAIWQHQRLKGHRLRTVDGRALHVLHPGFLNREAGPDFRGAVLRLGGELLEGDVEIDLHPSGWRNHGHAGNPEFSNVVLHVVWEAGKPASQSLPLLPLQGALDSPPKELADALGGALGAALPEGLKGKCAAPLRDLPPGAMQSLLEQAALERLRQKGAAIRARARQAGWEQALWEGLFAALGYKQNTWPMRRLAELLPRLREGLPEAPPPVVLQVRLLGAGGLLPAEPRLGAKSTGHVRRLWDQWWRDRDAFEGDCLPRAVWRFHGLRPANRPERRLALAAQWLAKPGFVDSLENWLAQPFETRRWTAALLELLQGGEDDYWSWHWSLRSGRLSKPRPLLGATRAGDLAVNVILPWLHARAGSGRNKAFVDRAQERFFHWPKTQDNARLRVARERLFGGSGGGLKTAAHQQGLLQILHDFCAQSNALCEDCPFPGLARRFGEKT